MAMVGGLQNVNGAVYAGHRRGSCKKYRCTNNSCCNRSAARGIVRRQAYCSVEPNGWPYAGMFAGQPVHSRNAGFYEPNGWPTVLGVQLEQQH